MTREEYDMLIQFICSNEPTCGLCPINQWNPCSKETPKDRLLYYARQILGSSEEKDPKISEIISRLSKAVVV